MTTPVTTSHNRRKLEFFKKLKQIEADEKKLKSLELELIGLQTRMALESTPLMKRFCELRFENLTKLKQHLSDPSFKKKEKSLITHFMAGLAIGLQGMGDERAEIFIAELIPEEENEEEQKFESREYFEPHTPQKLTESKLEIKSLFRQLAKVFHPDKEPLEHLKEEKTALMKKITEAYENQDLYGLLKFEKEHMEPREFTEAKIELYIKHINDRLKELKRLENRLKKHGPLSQIYKYIYSRKTTIMEFNIQNELSKIEDEVKKEGELQNVIWDRSSLINFLKR